MTEPVNTDALRDMKNTENLWPKNATLVDVAADEVDRLRAEVAEWNPIYGRLSQERDRLRAVIENAPHDHECMYGTYVEESCTCWKSDAL